MTLEEALKKLYCSKQFEDYGKTPQSFFGVHLYIEERGLTMQVINGLEMELSNQEYFTDEQNTQFCIQDNLFEVS